MLYPAELRARKPQGSSYPWKPQKATVPWTVGVKSSTFRRNINNNTPSIMTVLENLKESVNGFLKTYDFFGRFTIHRDAAGKVTVIIETTKNPTADLTAIQEQLADHLRSQFDLKDVAIAFTNTQSPPRPLAQIRHLVAVASGKGGVGKSTVALNLSLALARLGHRVGLVDGDIYGPSLPTLMGEKGKPAVHNHKFVPFVHQGVSWMSMGSLLGDNTPAVWRGPMAQKAFLQLFNDVNWGELDYLIVDMPPGTGDIQLALAQRLPVSGALLVSTPQDLALQDVRRGLEMFKKVHIPVLGLVENMSLFRCPHCDNTTPIFGHDLKEQAQEMGLNLLVQIPLDMSIRTHGDQGKGLPESLEDVTFAPFYDLARQVQTALA